MIENKIKFIKIDKELTHVKYINGNESWYDKHNKIVHTKSNDILGVEMFYEYDENDKLIYVNHSYGYEIWYDRDEQGRIIHIKDNNGFEDFITYDE